MIHDNNELITNHNKAIATKLNDYNNELHTIKYIADKRLDKRIQAHTRSQEHTKINAKTPTNSTIPKHTEILTQGFRNTKDT